MTRDLAQALAQALGGAPLRARVVRASRIELPLPPAAIAAGPGERVDALIAAFDAASITGMPEELAACAPDERIVLVVPPASQSLVGQVLARARRVGPVPVERVCTALRHAGVVDVRVAHVPGTLRLAVVSGRASAP